MPKNSSAEWNWIAPYQKFVNAARSGAPHPNFVRGGLKDGFVTTSALGPAVKPDARKKIEDVKAAMMKGGYTVFKGELKDNTGKVQIPAGKAYTETAPELESMNYLVAGVVGKA